MLHFEPSWVPATCHLGSPISCVKFFFPTHLNNKKLLRCALHCLEARPTTLLGTLKNPNPFSCFVLTLPKPSYTLSAILGTHMGSPNPSRCLIFEPSQTLFISLLRTMKQPTPFSWFVHGQPKPLLMLYFEPSQTLPTPPWRTIESSVRRGEKKLQIVFPGSPKIRADLIKLSHVMCQKMEKSCPLGRVITPMSCVF